MVRHLMLYDDSHRIAVLRNPSGMRMGVNGVRGHVPSAWFVPTERAIWWDLGSCVGKYKVLARLCL